MKPKSYIMSALLTTSLLSGCAREFPREVKATVETVEIRGVKTRIYKDEMKPGVEYLDFYPYGDADISLFDSENGKHSRNWLERRREAGFHFNALEEDALNRGLIAKDGK